MSGENRPLGEELDMDWPDDMDSEGRIKNIVGTLREPRSANWIAQRADVSLETTQEYLERLVTQGKFIATTSDGGETLYFPDAEQHVIDRIIELADHSRDHLTTLKRETEEEITEIQSGYDAETPTELRQTIDPSHSADERQQRKKDARRWEKNQHFQSLLKVALEYRRHKDRYS